MRSDRFWMMENQICRIKSENDLRFINANSANVSKDAAKTVTDVLVLELGDKYQIERPTIVKPQADAGARLRAFQQG